MNPRQTALSGVVGSTPMANGTYLAMVWREGTRRSYNGFGRTPRAAMRDARNTYKAKHPTHRVRVRWKAGT